MKKFAKKDAVDQMLFYNATRDTKDGTRTLEKLREHSIIIATYGACQAEERNYQKFQRARAVAINPLPDRREEAKEDVRKQRS